MSFAEQLANAQRDGRVEIVLKPRDVLGIDFCDVSDRGRDCQGLAAYILRTARDDDGFQNGCGSWLCRLHAEFIAQHLSITLPEPNA